MNAFGGELLLGETASAFRGVSIDSRTLQAGQLFICIRGERFDGHKFLREALARNAAGVVLSDFQEMPADFLSTHTSRNLFVIRVPETLTALQELARYHRQRIAVRVVAVTGTNGKTTTKEMIASIAETTYRTLKTEGNLNNHIGLPLTLLQLKPDHEVAVLEMGMSAAGEIKRLAEIAGPEIGVITNISEGHLIQLKTLKNVQAAKGELFDALDASGTAVVNADDPLVYELAQSLRAKKISFGIDRIADVQAKDPRPGEEGYDFTANLFAQAFPVHTPFLGACNVYNALAAIAATHVLGVSPEKMAAGIANTKLPANRYEIHRLGSMTIIDDSYNANPRSMREALTTLMNHSATGRKIFAIGDMLELGESEQTAHDQLGEDIARQGVDILIAVGELAALAAQSASEAGMGKDNVHAFRTRPEAVQFLQSTLFEGDCLMVKGSRGAGMEQVVQSLLKTSALR